MYPTAKGVVHWMSMSDDLAMRTPCVGWNTVAMSCLYRGMTPNRLEAKVGMTWTVGSFPGTDHIPVDTTSLPSATSNVIVLFGLKPDNPELSFVITSEHSESTSKVLVM